MATLPEVPLPRDAPPANISVLWITAPEAFSTSYRARGPLTPSTPSQPFVIDFVSGPTTRNPRPKPHTAPPPVVVPPPGCPVLQSVVDEVMALDH
jgi:hypothetical protein